LPGALGTLGKAFGRICQQRCVSHRLLTRAELDITNARSIAKAIEIHQPWAIVNTAGYVQVDQAEPERELCMHSEDRFSTTNAWCFFGESKTHPISSLHFFIGTKVALVAIHVVRDVILNVTRSHLSNV